MLMGKIDIDTIDIPEWYELVKKDEVIVEEKRVEEKIEMQKILDTLSEPTDEELIQYGKQFHPYYELLHKINE